MSFELVREETFAENVRRIAGQRLDRIIAALSVPPLDPEVVHGSRRNLKKLRALLRLARTGLGEDTFGRENACFRDAARVLSAARDARVLVEAFDRLRGEIAGDASSQALERLRQGLVAGVESSAAGLGAEGGDGGRLPEVVEELRAARERIDHRRWTGWEDAWHVPGSGVEKVYRRGRRFMRRAAETPAEADFHEWRKQGKHLAAQVRLLRPTRPRALKKLGKRLDRLAEILGEEHDLSVLGVKVAEQEIAALPGEPEVAADFGGMARQIEAHRRRLQQKALALGQEVFRKKTGRFVRRLEEGWEAWREG